MTNAKKQFATMMSLCLALADVGAQSAQIAPPAVNIAQGPLFSGIGNVHPNMILDLSVEFPTVGAAYRGASDYSKATSYLGYFNPLMCYTYPVTKVPAASGNPAYTVPDLNEAATGMAYFSISKNADANHECGGDSFSGNFMNWASSSSIDMLRYALTGGDRTTDTVTTTVLQRAYLRDVGGTFYASGSNFPRRVVTASATVSAPGQVTPFSTTTLYIVSCRNRILFSNAKLTHLNNNGNEVSDNDCDTVRLGGTPAAPIATDKFYGEYLTRVKVCDATEGPVRKDIAGGPNFCQKYGSNYKPEGDLQRNSDKIRVAAFGYLTDTSTSASNLYGGVLRGPAKYLGQKKFDAPAFSESVNDKYEWDAATGVFYNNPEDASDRNGVSNSGVINYLNKFGRTNPARLGQYKTYDSVSELYYESIRYLQGRQPTADALSALGAATTDDNFPVIKTWVDPVTASCQSNYIVTIGDANTHYDRYIPGNSRSMNGDVSRAADTASTQWPALDVMAQSNLIGIMEKDTSLGNSAPRAGLAGLGSQDTGSNEHGTYYIAGLAYWANTNDIRLDKKVRVKTFSVDVDENGNGSIEDTSTRPVKPRNSQYYLAAKYGGFDDKNLDGNPFKTITGTSSTLLTNNFEWTGTATGTDPANYFLASDPAKMVNAIHRIFASVTSNSGTISGVTLTSTKISTDSSYVYQPGFDPSRWGGSLLKLELKLVDIGTGDKTAPGYVPNMVVKIQDAKAPTWDAGSILTGTPATTIPAAPAVAGSPAPAARKIYTAKVETNGSLTTIPFAWASLTPDQKELLDKSPVLPFVADGKGESRVSYLRGNRTDEIGNANGQFRQRDRVLGDIINSNPTYVAGPATSLQGDDYKTFYESKKSRTKAVYVGANDGMLHAFAAENGKELFAYVPNAVIAGLNKLTDPGYLHQPFVDGTMTVGEAYVDGAWKTVLASGMGGGVQGAFVLDVTNPSDFAGGTGAIWEFTDKDDADMGNLASPPLVAKFRTSVSGAGVPTYKYFVVIPGGLNNYVDDGAGNFGAGSGALFLLSLDKKPGEAWALGSNYYKFTTPVKEAALKNGMSSPALVVGNDGAVKYAYAGDLQGNLWRFDFTGAAPWATSARQSDTPVFTAKDEDGVRQPITQQPKVVFAPGGGYVVLFGTGKYVEQSDAVGPFSKQSFYGIYDTTFNSDAVTGRTQLAGRTLAAVTSGGNDAMKITGSNFSYGAKKGWYLDFRNAVTTGERSVTNALVAYGKLFFNSLVTGSDPCTTGGGRTYSLDALSGLPLDSHGDGSSGETSGYISTVGMLSSPVLFDISTSIGDRNSLGQRDVIKKYSVFNFGTGGSDGAGGTTKMADAAKNGAGLFKPAGGRQSWREVVNYQELHEAAIKP